MVGGTWVTDVKDPSDGTVTHVENHIRWAPNHQAIEFNTDFNGKPHYYGFYAYNPVAKAISFYYTNSEGELTIGTATPDPDGKTLLHEFDIMHPNGKTGHVRSTVRARRKRRLLVHASSCRRMASGHRCSRFATSGSEQFCAAILLQRFLTCLLFVCPKKLKSG